MVKHSLVMLAVLTTAPVFAQDRGSWTLKQEWGRARYSECQLTAHVSSGYGSAVIRCVWNSKPPRNDLYLHRELTSAEKATLLTLAQASDFYAGGHAGGGGDVLSEGPFD